MKDKFQRFRHGQKIIPPRQLNEPLAALEHMLRLDITEESDFDNSGRGPQLAHQRVERLVKARVAVGGVSGRVGSLIGTGNVHVVVWDGADITPRVETLPVYNWLTDEFVAGDDVHIYKDQEVYWIQPASLLGGGGSSGNAFRCQCLEAPSYYLLDIECGLCGPVFEWDACDEVLIERTRKMPRIWRLTIESDGDNDGDVIDLNNVSEGGGYEGEVPTCEWQGRGPHCQNAELSFTETHARVSITPKADECTGVIFSMPLEEFDCCGENTGWTYEGEGYPPEDACATAITLEPHPCVCCPDQLTPPLAVCDGEPVQMPATLFYDDGHGIGSAFYSGVDESIATLHWWRGKVTRTVESCAIGGTTVDPFATVCVRVGLDTCYATSLGDSGPVEMDVEIGFSLIDGCWFFNSLIVWGNRCDSGGCPSPVIIFNPGAQLWCDDGEHCGRGTIEAVQTPFTGVTGSGDIAASDPFLVSTSATNPHFELTAAKTIASLRAAAFFQAPGWNSGVDAPVAYNLRIFC